MQTREAKTALVLPWAEALRQFAVHLRARQLARPTIEWYLQHLREAARYLVEEMGLADDALLPAREHLECYLAWAAERVAPESLRARYKALRAFYRWLLEEGEIARHPLEHVPWPKVPPKAPRGVTVEQVRAMVRACGQDPLGRRNAALIAFLFDTGWRASEACQATVEMAYRNEYVAIAKGGREVVAAVAPRVAELVNRWLRVRGRLPGAERTDALWLGRGGAPLTRLGVYEVVAATARAAGLGHVHPHQLRHGHAYEWLRDGGSVMDLKENLGHSSVAVTEVYARWLARERAREARERHGPGRGL